MTRTAIKFGMFVALCMGFTVYLASTIGNTSVGGLVGRGPSTYTVKAAFNDVTGLLIDDNVKVSGVPVGKVTGIDVNNGKATVTMSIRSEHKIPDDATASIRWRNLIGQRYVYLNPGASTVSLDKGAFIASTTDVVDLGELFNRLGPIVATIDESKVNDFLDTVTTALEGNEQSISDALDDLAFLVQGLKDRDEAIGRLFTNLEVVSRTIADRDDQLETLLDNLVLLSQTFGDNTALLNTAITEIGAFNRDLSSVLVANRTEIDGLLGSLDNTLNTVEDQLDPLETVLDRVDEFAGATFRSSSYGTWLNQDILCFTVSPPPCNVPDPVPGLLDTLGGVLGTSSADAGGSSSAVAFRDTTRRGSAAIASLVGGQP